MSTIQTEGFFSYAHVDDYRARLQKLRKDLCAEYRIVTGVDLSLFIDRVNIDWGERWEEELRASVDRSAFFLPVLSPNYFASPYCRKELTQFLSKVRRQDGGQLLLPILYATGPDSCLGDDPLVREVMKYQFEDWTELRLSSRNSSRYRAGINRMALRLAQANTALSSPTIQNARPRVDEVGEPISVRPTDAAQPDDYIEVTHSRFQEANERATVLLKEISDRTDEIGSLVATCTPRIVDARARGDEDEEHLALANLETELSPAASSYEVASKELFEATFTMDQSLRALAQSRVLEAEEYRESVGELCEVATDSRKRLEGYRDAARETAQLSRLIYAPMAAIDHATTRCMAALDVILDWRGLRVDDSPKG